MTNNYTLSAVTRTEVGKAQVGRLRRLAGMVPAVVYGEKKDPQSIKLKENEVLKAFSAEGIYSQVWDLTIDGKENTVIVKSVRHHPTKPKVLHIDFQHIAMNKPITVSVPLHFLGQEDAPGQKAGGVVSHVITELSVTCLPNNLPEFIAVDISSLELEGSLSLLDIKLPENVEHAQGEIDKEHNLSVVAIHKPRVEAEPVENAADAEDDSADKADEKDDK